MHIVKKQLDAQVRDSQIVGETWEQFKTRVTRLCK